MKGSARQSISKPLIAAVCSRAVFVGGHPDRYVRIADHGNFNPSSVKPLSVRGVEVDTGSYKQFLSDLRPRIERH